MGKYCGISEATAQMVLNLIKADDDLLARAIVWLLSKQTPEEIGHKASEWRNHVGYSKLTVKDGQFLAEHFLEGKELTPGLRKLGHWVCHVHRKQLAAHRNEWMYAESLEEIMLEPMKKREQDRREQIDISTAYNALGERTGKLGMPADLKLLMLEERAKTLV